MFKKEYLLFFAVIGIAIAYAFFSILVFITRGKRGSLLAKKIALGTMIIAFTAVLNTGSIAQAQEAPTPTPVYGTVEPTVEPPVPMYGVLTPDPTVEPTPTPTLEPQPDYATPVPTQEPLPEYGTPQMGDVNMDYKVNIVDALLISQYYVGLIPDPYMDYGTPIPFYPEYADVDKSTRINITDALLVSQKYVGIIEEFPDNSPPED